MSETTTTNATADNQPPRRLLGVWAHPDDEAYLAAGLMAETIDAGGSVTVIAVTDGEAGFPDDDTRPAPLRAEQRRSEMRAAMRAIGVYDLRFLGLPDGRVAETATEWLAERIATTIREVRPEAITTFGPDGITGHDDHIATGRATTQAWLGCNVGQLWYAAKTTSWLDEWRDLHDQFGVWMTDEPTGVADDDLEFVVDLDDAQLDRKRRVLAGHGSQTDGLAQAFGHDTYREWVRQEAFRRPSEAELLAVDASLCIANWCHSTASAPDDFLVSS